MTNEEFQKAIFAKLEKLEINQIEMQKTQAGMLKTQVEMQKTQAEMLKAQVEMQRNQAGMQKTQAKMQRKLDVVYAEVAGLLEFRSEIIENMTSINEMLGDHELSIKTLKRKTE